MDPLKGITRKGGTGASKNNELLEVESQEYTEVCLSEDLSTICQISHTNFFHILPDDFLWPCYSIPRGQKGQMEALENRQLNIIITMLIIIHC